MKRLVFDIDNTLTLEPEHVASPYSEREPNLPVIEKLKAYKAQGFEIILASSRNMRTHQNNIGRINALTLPVIIGWLEKHGIPFDEVHVGKPWCGHDGFYIDDKAIRPSEFLAMDYDQIRSILDKEPNG